MATSTSSSAHDIAERVTSRLDDLRDRTADAISADDSPAWRELTRVGHRLDDVESSLSDQLSGLASRQDDLVAELHAETKRTTLPRKVFWLAFGAAVGAAASWLADPDRGRARRAELSQRAGSVTRDAADTARAQASRVANEARGVAVEAVRDVLPDDVPDDPRELRQRIDSQVIGHHDDVADVVVTVDGPGHVRLTGTMHSVEAATALRDDVAGVNGVTRVDSDVAVPTA